MKKLLWIALPLVILIMILPLLQNNDTETYIQEFEEEIDSRKRYLEFNDESPFNQFDIPYRDPEYFAYNPEFRVEARVDRNVTKDIVRIQTSTGESEAYSRFCYLDFTLKGEAMRLLVLKPMMFGGSNILFCAFADETSSELTYGGGRYLDVSIGKSDKVTLDFNLAYNPYCAYADDYVCPLPPRENILPIAINAGEKIYKSTN